MVQVVGLELRVNTPQNFVGLWPEFPVHEHLKRREEERRRLQEQLSEPHCQEAIYGEEADDDLRALARDHLVGLEAEVTYPVELVNGPVRPEFPEARHEHAAEGVEPPDDSLLVNREGVGPGQVPGERQQPHHPVAPGPHLRVE